jgi:hypothetical protein
VTEATTRKWWRVDFVPRRQMRELHLEEIEIVGDRGEILAGLISLAQREMVFIWHAPGMLEDG